MKYDERLDGGEEFYRDTGTREGVCGEMEAVRSLILDVINIIYMAALYCTNMFRQDICIIAELKD